MSKVTFRSKQAFLQVSHETIFHVGVVSTPYDGKGRWIGSTAEWEKLQSLPDPEDIIRVRERIANDPDYTEISCDAEAKALGGGSGEHIEGRDHSKHIEELNRKYGGDEEPEYSEWDRSLISKIKQ